MELPAFFDLDKSSMAEENGPHSRGRADCAHLMRAAIGDGRLREIIRVDSGGLTVENTSTTQSHLMILRTV
ncbi:hypothetical protein ZHAS_00021549 [Anopheles sinensis]|uniref:Uncharacterized protein n=1 Tax=Anopheles sinensis TaxID=74873 RepID=A0A084WSQ3_ANOSI|nr:hypothetical protein ZHAS_00021549 [Anopheles sinensis]